MVVDWSAECSAEDPVLVVPWDPDPAHPGIGLFVDLRENPYDLDQIAEAEQHPALLQALRALNAPRSPVFTAKCDTWPLEPDELDALRFHLELASNQPAAGFASYIDLLWRERVVFVSFHQQEQRLQRLARLATPLDHPLAMVETVLRPALVDLAGPQEGFAVSLYVKAAGTDTQNAYENWSRALEAIAALLRARDFAGS
jgi:hypothetical protein